MSEEYNSNKENDVEDNHVSEVHKNNPYRATSPYFVLRKALPLALGMAAIFIIITVVVYLLLK